MNVNKKQGRFIHNAIEQWERDGIIDHTMGQTLQATVHVRPFDWKRLAKYSFWVAIICTITAVSSVLADEFLAEILTQFFSSSDVTLCLLFSIAAASLYYLGIQRRRTKPLKVFSNEAAMFAGVLSTAVAIGYFGHAVDAGSGHYSLLFLLATLVYGALGLWFPSILIWIFAILSLGAWFGTETGYVSGGGMYFLGMNYPLRFILFGPALIAISFVMKRSSTLAKFFSTTYKMGLLYLFIALWILSIVGNHADMDKWMRIPQIDMFGWSILFGVAAVATIYYGLRNDDSTSRSFGITFLFINLYTRYFEYLWNITHKAIFFSVLAFSFWYVGSKAESIWNLEFLNSSRTDTSTDEG